MKVTEIIYYQLVQTNIRLVWCWGAHDWTELNEYTLAFKVNAHRLDGIVCVTLDYNRDLYDISFFHNKTYRSLRKTSIEAFEPITGVYFEQLVYFIDDVTEKIDVYKY